MSRVIHFEIPADDPNMLMNFYKEVFDWSYTAFPNQEYWFAKTGPENTRGIDGAVMKKRDPAQPIVNNIGVANISKAIDKIVGHGGTIVVPPMPIPGAGWLAYFKDPEGNIFGLHQTA